MKAVVWHCPRTVSVDEVDYPKIQEPTDAIIKVTASAICGSDRHMYDGVEPGNDGCSAYPGGARSGRPARPAGGAVRLWGGVDRQRRFAVAAGVAPDEPAGGQPAAPVSPAYVERMALPALVTVLATLVVLAVWSPSRAARPLRPARAGGAGRPMAVPGCGGLCAGRPRLRRRLPGGGRGPGRSRSALPTSCSPEGSAGAWRLCRHAIRSRQPTFGGWRLTWWITTGTGS